MIKPEIKHEIYAPIEPVIIAHFKEIYSDTHISVELPETIDNFAIIVQATGNTISSSLREYGVGVGFFWGKDVPYSEFFAAKEKVLLEMKRLEVMRGNRIRRVQPGSVIEGKNESGHYYFRHNFDVLVSPVSELVLNN